MADEVKTEQTEETTAQPETQPTADKVDIKSILQEAAEKSIKIGENRREGSFKSQLIQAGIAAEIAAQETEKWIAATKQHEMDIEKLKSERDALSEEAARAKVLDQKFVAIEKGIPAKLADKYVKLAEAYPMAEDFTTALDQAIADFPYKTESPKYTAPASGGALPDSMRQALGLK